MMKKQQKETNNKKTTIYVDSLMKRFCPLAYLNDFDIDFRLHQFDYLVKILQRYQIGV